MTGQKYNSPSHKSGPCGNCQNRSRACWSTCEKYRAFVEERASARTAKQQAAKEEHDFVSARRFPLKGSRKRR